MMALPPFLYCIWLLVVATCLLNGSTTAQGNITDDEALTTYRMFNATEEMAKMYNYTIQEDIDTQKIGNEYHIQLDSHTEKINQIEHFNLTDEGHIKEQGSSIELNSTISNESSVEQIDLESYMNNALIENYSDSGYSTTYLNNEMKDVDAVNPSHRSEQKINKKEHISHWKEYFNIQEDSNSEENISLQGFEKSFNYNNNVLGINPYYNVNLTNDQSKHPDKLSRDETTTDLQGTDEDIFHNLSYEPQNMNNSSTNTTNIQELSNYLRELLKGYSGYSTNDNTYDTYYYDTNSNETSNLNVVEDVNDNYSDMLQCDTSDDKSCYIDHSVQLEPMAQLCYVTETLCGDLSCFKLECNESVQVRNLSQIINKCGSCISEISVRNQPLFRRIGKYDLQNYINVRHLSITDTSLSEVEESAFKYLHNLNILELRGNQLVTLSWRAFTPNIEGVLLGIEELEERLLWLEKLDVRLEEEHLDHEGCDNAWLRERGQAWPKPLPGHSLNYSNCSLKSLLLTRSTKIVPSNDYLRGPLAAFTCTASGNPKPQIRWVVPCWYTWSSSNISNGSTVSSYINITGTDRTGCKGQHKDLLKLPNKINCIAENKRAIDIEKDDLCVEGGQPARINTTNIGPMSCHIVASGSPPYRIKWFLAPCKKSCDNLQKKKHTFVPQIATNNSFHAKLIFYDSVKWSPPGDYILELGNLCGPPASGASCHKKVESPHPGVKCETSVRCDLPLKIPSFVIPTTTLPTQPTLPATTSLSTSTPATTSLSTSTPTSETPPLSIILTAGTCIAVLVVGVTYRIAIFFHNKRHRQPILQQDTPVSPFQITFISGCLCRDMEQQKKGTEGPHAQELMPLRPERLFDNPSYLEPIQPPRSQAPQIGRERVRFVSELGEGAFGRVYLGEIEKPDGSVTQVAVKTLKTAGPEAKQELEREVNLLSNLQHPNIISFFGVCYSVNPLDPMLMVFEYMEHGDLNNYLRCHNEEASRAAGESTALEPLSVMDLLQIALQVAAGMKYLASQHYVHRDLATRNCLVGAECVVKIGDFGMSRDVYTTDYYQFGERTLLPVRWMPPESILYRYFTIESDTWSFGVVLWEIFTGGVQPWYGYTNQEVITQITAGKVLSCPEICPPDMYRVMVTCFAKNPQERLSMANLYNKIKGFTTVDSNYLEPLEV